MTTFQRNNNTVLIHADSKTLTKIPQRSDCARRKRSDNENPQHDGCAASTKRLGEDEQYDIAYATSRNRQQKPATRLRGRQRNDN